MNLINILIILNTLLLYSSHSLVVSTLDCWIRGIGFNSQHQMFLTANYLLQLFPFSHSKCLFVCFRSSKALQKQTTWFQHLFCTYFHSFKAFLKSEKWHNFQGLKSLSSRFWVVIYFHNAQPWIFEISGRVMQPQKIGNQEGCSSKSCSLWKGM